MVNLDRAGAAGAIRAQSKRTLTRARIAVGLSQAALAERLGLKPQQIQRYEAARYAKVGIERLQAVADALGVKIRERVILPARGDE